MNFINISNAAFRTDKFKKRKDKTKFHVINLPKKSLEYLLYILSKLNSSLTER